MKTRVFARGVVVVEQVRIGASPTTYTESVEWLHSDPVTGSRHRVPKSGDFTPYEHERIELEPLGQEVQPQAPPVEPPAQPSFTSFYSADNPEWLCSLPYDSSWEMPVHCRIPAIENEPLLLQ